MIKFKLRKYLRNKEITQQQLGEMTDIRPGTINAYYHGYAKRLNVKDLNIMCNALGCRLDELLEHVPDKNKQLNR
jgi:putative transcriptional regulator